MAVTVSNPDNVGEFEKKIRSQKVKNPNEKTVPTYDDGKYIGNLTQEEMRDYQEKQKEKKNTKINFLS